MKNKFNFHNAIEKTNFKYVQNSKWFAIGSALIIIAGLIVWICCGFNLGMDFTGGSIIDIKMGTVIETNYTAYVDQIKEVLTDNGLTLSSAQKSGEGADMSIIVRYQMIDGMSDTEMNELNIAVVDALEDEFPTATVSESESIGPTASATLLLNAMTAILVAVVAILVYIAIRFELGQGLASIISLLHDVLIMLALVTMFRIEINSSFVAAVITIIGYSINNTIVVFDRVRENKKSGNYADINELTNNSIKQTLTRSLFTSLTTMIAVLFLAIFGVVSLQQFVIPILFGLVAGTYSSIFLAGPTWAVLSKNKFQNAK